MPDKIQLTLYTKREYGRIFKSIGQIPAAGCELMSLDSAQIKNEQRIMSDWEGIQF